MTRYDEAARLACLIGPDASQSKTRHKDDETSYHLDAVLDDADVLLVDRLDAFTA